MAQISSLVSSITPLSPGWDLPPGPGPAALPVTLHRRILGRDGHRCQAPGCGRTENLAVHRIDPTVAAGRHDPANLVTVCAVCLPLWDLMGRGPFLQERAERRGGTPAPHSQGSTTISSTKSQAWLPAAECHCGMTP